MRNAPTKEKKKEVRDKWDAMLERMGKRDIDAFLRHMWLSKYGDVKARGLFAEIKTNLEAQKISSLEFASECSDECDTYSAILELSDTVLRKAKPHVAGLVKYLGATSSYPLLLSGLRCLSETDFEKLVKYTVDLFVRHSVFANSNPSDLETAFYKAARAIRDRKKIATSKSKDCLADAQSVLAGINPTNSQVQVGAAELVLTRSKALYLMAQLTNAMQSATKELAIDDANLEHIYPHTTVRLSCRVLAASSSYPAS